MKLPKPKLKKGLVTNIAAIVGEHGFSLNDIERLSYCRDSNFRSAIQAHYSYFENFPSIIVWPSSTEQISQLIKIAIKFKLAITPYGGGSGVCGGAVPYNGAMIIDTKLMNKVLRLDKERLFVDVQTGILGLNLEQTLARQGFTLGHFPSSILSACLGGYLAARSAGQLSSKYGKIEDLIIDLEFVDGQGKLHQTSDVSRSKGLDLTQIIVGSEGTLGIITKARLKIFPQPQHRLYHSYSFKNIEYGTEAMRRIMQTGIKPDVLRLYDELDSAFVLKKSSKHQFKHEDTDDTIPPIFKNSFKKLRSSFMNIIFRGHRLLNEATRLSWLGCVMIIMLEGEQKIIDQQLKIIKTICNDLDGKDLGKDPASYWHEHRYSVSYRASKLFLDGAFTDTMEVATTWDNILRLYYGVLKRTKSKCLVLAHISHVYKEGAAIYFTFVAPLHGLKSSVKDYDKLWNIALDAVQRFGGVLSHHHGIGRLKKNHIKKEWGEAELIYKNVKNYLDPNHVMNPKILY